jgi:hypothetical protein
MGPSRCLRSAAVAFVWAMQQFNKCCQQFHMGPGICQRTAVAVFVWAHESILNMLPMVLYGPRELLEKCCCSSCIGPPSCSSLVTALAHTNMELTNLSHCFQDAQYEHNNVRGRYVCTSRSMSTCSSFARQAPEHDRTLTSYSCHMHLGSIDSHSNAYHT